MTPNHSLSHVVVAGGLGWGEGRAGGGVGLGGGGRARDRNILHAQSVFFTCPEIISETCTIFSIVLNK